MRTGTAVCGGAFIKSRVTAALLVAGILCLMMEA